MRYCATPLITKIVSAGEAIQIHKKYHFLSLPQLVLLELIVRVLIPSQRLLSGSRVVTGRGVEWVLGVLMDESNEVLERPITVVVDKVTGTSLLKLDSWETGDTETSGRGDIVFSSLHLGTEHT